MTDAEYVALVEDLDDAVERVDGRGFRATPFGRSPALSDRLGFALGGGVWVKDETGGVAGSHKARHLMGPMVHLLVTERVGLGPATRPELAIASCGNAALAAATVATAAAWPLRVFVPTDGDPAVLARLEELGAPVTVCPRRPGVAGDPTVHRLREALRGGALPFTCQGNDNGLAIEGGLTLAYEIAADLAADGIAPDRLVVQVGGGALASACAQGLGEAVGMGMLPRMPAIHAVQTEGAAPLARAHRLLAERIAAHPGAPLEGHLADAATHRSSFMWPWEAKPRSVANGILDDETYDWLAVVRAMVETGGGPVVVGEERLLQANRLADEATGIPVDPTGSAGLAGLLELLQQGRIGPRERVVVLFTGVRR